MLHIHIIYFYSLNWIEAPRHVIHRLLDSRRHLLVELQPENLQLLDVYDIYDCRKT